MPSSFLCSLNDTLVIPHELIFIRVLIAKERFGKEAFSRLDAIDAAECFYGFFHDSVVSVYKIFVAVRRR